MAITAPISTRIRVDAPDAETAFALEKRLTHLHPVAVGRGRSWCVELEDSEGRMDEITAVVEHWLRDIGLHTTEMHVDGGVVTVGGRTADAPPLGAGYDGTQVLEHEP